MSRASRKPSLHTVLQEVQRGSVVHILGLLEDWPENLKDNIAATETVLFLLSPKRLPEGRLLADDYEIAKGCVIGTTRAMQAARHGPLSSQKHLGRIIDMLVGSLEDILQWMSACIQQCRTFVEENEGFLHSCRMLVGHWGAAITQYCFFHVRLGNAMQASPLAPSVVADLWSWIDPKTHQPPFMIELNDGIDIPCGIIDSLMCFIRDSTPASMAVLRALSQSDSSVDRDGARQMVRLGVIRLRIMRKACKKSMLDVKLIGRSVALVAEAFTFLFRTEEPNLLSALHDHAFLQELIATFQCVGACLWNTRDPPGPCSLLSIPAIEQGFQTWTGGAFSSSAAMCQIVRGGILSVLLETFAFVQISGVGNPRIDLIYKKDCEALEFRICAFLIFPSVIRAMSKFFDSELDRDMLHGVLKQKGHWTAQVWLSMQSTFEKRRAVLSALEQGPPFTICDNGYHDSGEGTLGHLQVCSRCHASFYCSAACQKEDWEECHRQDCEGLSEVYAYRNHERSWVHGSTRRYLFALVQDAFRSTIWGAEKHRKAKYPDSSPEDLVYFFNFFVPPYCTDERIAAPSPLDLPGYMEILKSKSSFYPIGIQRLKKLLVDFQAEPDIVIAEAMFLCKQDTLHVVARIRIPSIDGELTPELAVVVGGLTYLSTPDPEMLRNLRLP